MHGAMKSKLSTFLPDACILIEKGKESIQFDYRDKNAAKIRGNLPVDNIIQLPVKQFPGICS